MNEKELQWIVLRMVLTELAQAGEWFVPVTSSNRHVHLSQEDVERLFGSGYQLHKLRDLVQPGQYACQETLVLKGKKGSATLRVVGPTRRETQIELSLTDCHQLGIPPLLRMSGETAGTPGGMLVNGDRRINIPQGIMVAKRHLHLSPEEAQAYGLQDGDVVSLQVEGERATTLENIIVRSGPGHRLEAHIDKDEANASGVQDGQLCRIQMYKAAVTPMHQQACPTQEASVQALHTYTPSAQPATHPAPAVYTPREASETKNKLLDVTSDPHCFLSEDDVLSAWRNGYTLIRHAQGTVITPLARDTAAAKGLAFIELS